MPTSAVHLDPGALLGVRSRRRLSFARAAARTVDGRCATSRHPGDARCTSVAAASPSSTRRRSATATSVRRRSRAAVRRRRPSCAAATRSTSCRRTITRPARRCRGSYGAPAVLLALCVRRARAVARGVRFGPLAAPPNRRAARWPSRSAAPASSRCASAAATSLHAARCARWTKRRARRISGYEALRRVTSGRTRIARAHRLDAGRALGAAMASRRRAPLARAAQRHRAARGRAAQRFSIRKQKVLAWKD